MDGMVRKYCSQCDEVTLWNPDDHQCDCGMSLLGEDSGVTPIKHLIWLDTYLDDVRIQHLAIEVAADDDLRRERERAKCWESIAAGRRAALEDARRHLDKFDADKNTGECPYSRERLGCAVLHQFKARVTELTGIVDVRSKGTGFGHDFACFEDFGGNDERARCDAPSCQKWESCTMSRHCERDARVFDVPLVEVIINEATGNCTLRCRSYADR